MEGLKRNAAAAAPPAPAPAPATTSSSSSSGGQVPHTQAQTARGAPSAPGSVSWGQPHASGIYPQLGTGSTHSHPQAPLEPKPERGRYKADNTPKVKTYVPPTLPSANTAARIYPGSGRVGLPPPPGTTSFAPFASAQTSIHQPQQPAYPRSQPHSQPSYTAPEDEELEAALATMAIPDFAASGALDDEDARNAAIEAMVAQAVDLEDDDDDDDDDASAEADALVPGLSVRLMPHQVQGYKWMVKREAGRYKGGILADDMGLGKTVQALALIVGNAPEHAHSTVKYIVEEAGGAQKGAKAKSKAKKGAEGQAEAEAEKPEKREIELRSNTTLIVAPVAVMKQWETEIREKSNVGLKVLIHHGNTKAKSAAAFKKYDVVITSFSTAASEYGVLLDDFADAQSDKKPPLFGARWLRIVLDEAHNIKNHKTKAAEACYLLSDRAHSRWCLTGTPIQNRSEEMFSIIHFLGIPPFDDYQTFKEKIAEPLRSSNQNRVNWGLKRLCVVLQTILLRRTKDAKINGRPLIQLPKREVQVVMAQFDSEEEEAFYREWEARAQKNADKEQSAIGMLVLLLRLRQATSHPWLVDKGIQGDVADMAAVEEDASAGGGSKGKKTTTTTTKKKKTNAKKQPESQSQSQSQQQDSEDELADLFENISIARKRCTRCQVSLRPDEDEIHPGTLCSECFALKCAQSDASPGRTDWSVRTSTKVRVLLDLLEDIRSSGDEKTIVFSQFTSFLDLLEPHLRAAGLGFARYDGSMPTPQRDAALARIRGDPPSKTRVLLLSFKAGSTGLNLTACSRVVLMDLWWNPQLEEQAFDRAHRVGQARDVRITKVCIENTVESRILTLQDKKRELSTAVLEGSRLKKGGTRLSKEELAFLFRGAPPVL